MKLMNMRRLSKKEIENLRISDLVNVKILYCEQIEFITGNTMPDIKEYYQMCKVVYKRGNNLYLRMNDEIKVVDIENCYIYR